MKTFVLGSHRKASKFCKSFEKVSIQQNRVPGSIAIRGPLILSFDNSTGKINLHDGADLAEAPLMELKASQFNA